MTEFFKFAILNAFFLLLALWLYSIPALISPDFMSVIILLIISIMIMIDFKIIFGGR